MDTLTYEGFVNVIKGTVIKSLGEEYRDWHVMERDVYKINEKLHALYVMPPGNPEKNAAANIYLEEFYDEYEKGRSIYRILDEICDRIRSAPENRAMIDFADNEVMRRQVIPILINAEINEEYLKELPHRRFLDLAIVYRSVLRMENNTHLGAMVTWDILENWGMSFDALEKLAMSNLEKKAGIKMIEMHYIKAVTNQWMLYGAYNGLCRKEILKDISAELGSDVYIVPSSIHEAFFVSANEFYLSELRKTAEGACAAGILEDTDFLSKNIYVYSREKDSVEIA